MLLPFPFLLVLVAAQGLSPWLLAAWLSLPLAVKGINIFWRHFSEPGKLVQPRP